MPREKVDWGEVVDLKPKGYCEIQDLGTGIVIHGPIKEIRIGADDFVTIELKWAAQMGLPGRQGFGEWVRSSDENLKFVMPNLMVPYVIEPTPEKGDRVRFGANIIYLDPQTEDDAHTLTQIS